MRIASKVMAAIMLFGILAFATPITTHADSRDDLLGVWEGTYTIQGATQFTTRGLTLVIFRQDLNYHAVFNFYPVGESTATGNYLMDITANAQVGMFNFTATTWIHQPGTYGTLDLLGTLSGDQLFGSIPGRTGDFWLARAEYNSFPYDGWHDHFGSETILVGATCTSLGERLVDCIICGQTVWEHIPMLPHTPSGTWVVLEEATCETPGLRVQYCTVSGSIAMEEVIPSVTGQGHVFESTPISGSIFIPPIVTERVCEICGYTEMHNNFWFAWVSPAIVIAALWIIIKIIKALAKKKRNEKESTTFVCPFCFEEKLVKDVQFRCVNLRCDDVNDIELSIYEGMKINLKDLTKPIPKKGKPTFSVKPSTTFNIPQSASCPSCNQVSTKVICPACHNSLPDSSLTGEDMIISIVGSRAAGKSHYVGVIIHELIERVAGKFDGSLTSFDDTTERYAQSFGRKLYIDLQKLDLTQSSTENTNNGAYRPLIYVLTIEKSKKIKKYTLVFFDTAGEDLGSADKMNTVNKYICKSSGIIFLLDPLQIWDVRNQFDDKTLDRTSNVPVHEAIRPDDILTRVSDMIRNDRKRSKKASLAKIDIPVAVVFSKFDVIVPLIPEGSAVLNTSPHCDARAFVMSDYHNVNLEIQGLLKTWGATVVHPLERNYKNYSYFVASALGIDNAPLEDGKIERPRPHRIEDALLWVLKENKVIEATE